MCQVGREVRGAVGHPPGYLTCKLLVLLARTSPDSFCIFFSSHFLFPASVFLFHLYTFQKIFSSLPHFFLLVLLYCAKKSFLSHFEFLRVNSHKIYLTLNTQRHFQKASHLVKWTFHLAI